MPLRIDVVSDVVCPWCVIGYLQLQKALSLLDEPVQVDLVWHPFELNPDMPEGGQELREHLVQKYGPTSGSGSGMRERLEQLGVSLGFQFDYFEGMRMVNTFRAHQLMSWAADQGRQTPLALALFAAFFSERKDVSKTEVLLEAAVAAGLDKSAAADVLELGSYAQKVRNEQEFWREKEVYAVPTYAIQDNFMIPGAQDSETFVRILNKVMA